MVARLDISKGATFGRLTVLSEVVGAKPRQFKVQCSCGSSPFALELRRLTSGNTNSCGCYRRERMAKGDVQSTHGLSKHPLYATWRGMLARCYDPNHDAFTNYGGRGIKVCRAWRNDFESFVRWAEKAGWTSGLDVDRVNNNKGYSPANCRAVTRKENANNRRGNRKVRINGRVLTVTRAHAEFGRVGYSTVLARLDRGWKPARALTQPVR